MYSWVNSEFDPWMVELVDTLVLEASIERCESSSLSLGTKQEIFKNGAIMIHEGYDHW